MQRSTECGGVALNIDIHGVRSTIFPNVIEGALGWPLNQRFSISGSVKRTQNTVSASQLSVRSCAFTGRYFVISCSSPPMNYSATRKNQRRINRASLTLGKINKIHSDVEFKFNDFFTLAKGKIFGKISTREVIWRMSILAREKIFWLNVEVLEKFKNIDKIQNCCSPIWNFVDYEFPSFWRFQSTERFVLHGGFESLDTSLVPRRR